MRWVFSLLLLVNAIYFLWQNPLASVNKAAEVIPEGVTGVRLLREIDASLLLPRGSDNSFTDEGSAGGTPLTEDLIEGVSLEEQFVEAGSSEHSSLKKSSEKRDAVEYSSVNTPSDDLLAKGESLVLQGVSLNMLVNEQAVADKPAIDNPVIDTSVMDSPVIDNPVIDKPVIDTSVMDSPVIDNPVIDNPVIDNPVIDNPVIDNPVIDNPVIDTSIMGSSVIDKPVTDKPAMDNPAINGQWCQVVSGLNSEAEAQQLLEGLVKAGLPAEVKVSKTETVLTYELIMNKPVTAGENGALTDSFSRLDIQPQELQLNGVPVYVLGRFGSRNEADDALFRLKGKLAPRIYQVVSMDSDIEVWIEADDGAETSNKINLLASAFSHQIKIEKKSCKGVASTEGRD